MAVLSLATFEASPHTASWMRSCHGLPEALKASLKLVAIGVWPVRTVMLAIWVRGSALVYPLSRTLRLDAVSLLSAKTLC